VNESDLRTSIYLARRRFQQTRQMEARIDELQEELDDDQQASEDK
jgi:AmiR/NasT family two-component response regulator